MRRRLRRISMSLRSVSRDPVEEGVLALTKSFPTELNSSEQLLCQAGCFHVNELSRQVAVPVLYPPEDPAAVEVYLMPRQPCRNDPGIVPTDGPATAVAQ